MLARTPRNLGQFEEFIDAFGGAADAFSYDTFAFYDYTLPDLALDDFVNYDWNGFDVSQFDAADFSPPTLVPYDVGIPEFEPALDTVDVDTFPLQETPMIEITPLSAPETMAVLSPDQTALDIEDAEAGAFMRQAQVATAEETMLTEGGSGAWGAQTPAGSFSLPGTMTAPSAQAVLDTAARIAATGATIYATKTQADIAASRANLSQPAGATRYRSAIDPATGRAVIIDTLTGKPVAIDPATGLPAATQLTLERAAAFVKENALPLAVGGAILAVMLARGPTARRYRSKRKLKRGAK